VNVLAPALALFVILPLSASAQPSRQSLSAESLIADFAAAIDGKPKKHKKKNTSSKKPAKAPVPKSRPEALTAKPAPAEAKPKDGKTQDKPEESAQPKPDESAKVVPVPLPRPEGLVPKVEVKTATPAPQPEKAEAKKAEAKKGAEKKDNAQEAAQAPAAKPEKPADAKPAEAKADAKQDTKTAAEPEAAEAEIAEVPQPMARPKDLVPDYGPHPVPPGVVEAEVSLDPLPDPVCDVLEANAEIEFERLPRIMDGQCGATTPIRLKAFTPKDGPKVTFENPPTVTCRVAETALDWMRTSVQPAAIKHLGGTIRKLRQTGGYECRGRNRDPKAKLSEHGGANALDIGGFERENGVVVPVQDKGEAELGFLNDIRKDACGKFTTVLGPGVAAHEEHFHLDLARRGKDGRTAYCR
jgi:hypothetical protein